MPRKPKPAFWNGYWLNQDGVRVERLRRSDYPELWRLWTKHKDIREGRVSAR